MSIPLKLKRPTGGHGADECSALLSDLLELADRLRQEKLYIRNEKVQLRELNEKVKLATEKVSHCAWVAHQQRVNLERLTLGHITSSAFCCLRANLLERTLFQNAYKVLDYQEPLFSDFLRRLRARPKLLGACLTAGDKLNLPQMSDVVSILFGGLYGCCMMAEDESLVLKILQYLMTSQLTSTSNPRKLMRQKTCAFSRLYKQFNEEIFSAKLFLTSALYEPILSLLSDDEIFLDVDPSKTVIRFSPSERMKKFGQEGSPDFHVKLKQHRNFIVAKLESLTNNFIRGIRENLHCFPPSLARLLRAMHKLLTSSLLAEPKEAHAVCVDAVFSLFICPAMVDPNPLGIIDTPISYVARSNLMQVAQTLQVLAMWKLEEADPRQMDLYSRFDRQTVASIVEEILEPASEDAAALDEDDDDANKSQGSLTRTAVLLSHSQLMTLVEFFRVLSSQDVSSMLDVEELKTYLSALPADVPGKKHPAATAAADASLSSEQQKLPSEPDTVLVIPIVDGGHVSEPPGFLSEDHVMKISRQSDGRVVRLSLPGDEDAMDGGGGEEDRQRKGTQAAAGEKRTRFSLSQDDGSIGNTSDNLEAISEAASSHSVDSSLEECEVNQEGEVDDQMITDNLSDMVSANVSGRGTPNVSGRDTPSSQVTEGDEGQARNQENNDQNQQRHLPAAARPRVRPSAVGGLVGTRRNVVAAARKDGEPDLEEKFGRFEIKPPPRPCPGTAHGSGAQGSEVGDEAVSMVSDTWSTDVLASDTEGTAGGDCGGAPDSLLFLQHNRQPRASELGYGVLVPPSPAAPGAAAAAAAAAFSPSPSVAKGPSLAGNSNPSSSSLLDVTETASEAWSIDVMASDSGSLRLGEIDNEDAGSVARSDDTRFTDDTTRSDPDPADAVGAAATAGATGKSNLLRPSRVAAVEQWARQSVPKGGGGVGGGGSAQYQLRRGSDTTSSILKKYPLLDSRDNPDASGDAASKSAAKDLLDCEIEVARPGEAKSLPDGSLKRAMSASGAIPKSISFDKVVVMNQGESTSEFNRQSKPDDQRGMKQQQQQHKVRDKSFLKGFKFPKIGRNRTAVAGGKSKPNSDDGCLAFEARSSASSDQSVVVETSDEILAKYRQPKSDADPPVASGELVDGKVDMSDGGEPFEDGAVKTDDLYTFQDAKRKLRMMLSEADLTLLATLPLPGRRTKENDLVWMLRVQLAEALNLQDRNLVARLYETIRCVSLFDNSGCKKLVISLRDDYRKRSPYLSYLIRCRQGLLVTLAHQERLISRFQMEKSVCSSHLVSVCIRFFLEQREKQMKRFVQQFKEAVAADEKTALMGRFLEKLWSQLEEDSGTILIGQDLCHLTIERSVVSQIYVHAMYPNGEADVSRDEVLASHIKRLSLGLSPDHRDLKISPCYHYEAPWPSAQAEIRRLAAYKTPSDKVGCVAKTSHTIMNLLSLASKSTVPAADDFVPVMVYVLIMANPPSLLSTVQYVDSFYGNRMSGEDQYWWLQFSSAIEFIKTMDYCKNKE